jgi:AraC-like DNA-binding protein
MLATFTSALQNNHIQLRYPEGFTAASYLEERNNEITFTDGSIKINECWFDGICVVYSVFDSALPFALTFYYPKPCRIMLFTLDGEIEIGKGKIFMKITKDNGYSAYWDDLNASSILFHNAGIILAICLDEAFVDKLSVKGILPTDVKDHASYFIKKDLKAKLQVIVENILDASQSSYIKRLLLEAGIIELLVKQHQPVETKMLAAFNDADKSLLLEAKNIVEQNLKHPCSLIELSRKTGLNDFKLKKGFKALFGNTVFGYLTELRMNLAHKLLKEGRSVSEVAETVGYKNAHHFTAAFKKHFEMLPSKVSKLIIVMMGCWAWM